ncbi:MAG: polyketide cyclase [Sphingobacteriales bacterium]|nr:MAG: polyketide cyclase [Sphingobacteriales bacterium]
MSTNSVTLHRVLKAAPEKVFKAFTEARYMASWFPPYGFTCTIQEMNAEVGGVYRMTFHNFSTGSSQSFGGKFLELQPAEFIKLTDKFDDPNLPGEMTTSISFKKNMAGTDLTIVQEGIPEAIPAEMCYLGWQECLQKLAKLVEPEIPDA